MSDLPAGWEWSTLEDVGVEAQPGFASGKHNQEASGVLHLRPMNISRDGKLDLSNAKYVQDNSDRRVQTGDVLFNNTNSPALVGKTAIVRTRGPLAYSNHMTRLRPPPGIDPAFLAHQLHWLWASDYFKTVMSNHVNQASVSSKVLLRTTIVVPPSAEQRRIVAALDDHLSRLEAAEAALGSAERRMAVLSQARIGQLLDELAGGPGRTLATLLREPLRNGYSGRASPDGKGVRTLTLTAVTRAEFSDRFTKISSVSGRKVDDLWLEPGDILVQRSNTPDLVGTSALYSGPRNWAIFPDLLIRVRTNDEVLPEYVRLALSSHRIHSELKRSAKGLAGSMPKIDQGTLERISLPVPSLSTQEHVVSLAEAMTAGIDRLQSDLIVGRSHSGHLRRSLLADAFAGCLLPQDPLDEPASVLLERIRAQQASQPKTKRTRRTKADPAQEALL